MTVLLALLLVRLDDCHRSDGGTIGILTEFAARSPLSQQVPALIELDSNRLETNPVVVRQLVVRIQSLFLVRERLNPAEHAVIRRVMCHRSPRRLKRLPHVV